MNFWFLVFLFLPSTVLGASKIQTTLTILIDKGLNLKSVPSSIDDGELSDVNNMINTLSGSIESRLGSKRFISQSYSTNPIVSLYRAYASTGTNVKKVFMATTFDRIVYSTNDASPQWITLSSAHVHNQIWEYAMFQNNVIMTGNNLTSQIKKFDVIKDTMTDLLELFDTTNVVRIRAKHILVSRDHLFVSNVVLLSTPNALLESATYYNSRAYYSYQFQPSSFSYSRVLTFDEEDGEEVTAISEKDKVINFWKPSSIFELTFDFLAPLGVGGDQTVKKAVSGFGLFAPRTLANIGDFYIFGAKDGLRLWAGAKSRLQTEQESRVVSDRIEAIINRCIRAGTWKDAIGKYYPKKGWYLLSVSDPDLSPKNKHNLILVLDFRTLTWFKFKNLHAQSFETWDGAGDNGEIFYGDSIDGYVYQFDDVISENDAKRERSLHNMDNADDWIRGNQDVLNIREGTASVRLTLPSDARYASATYMAVIDVADWSNKTKVTKDDKLSFKIRGTSLTNLVNFRIDLEMENIGNEFNAQFTSVTFSSSALIGGDSTWNMIEVSVSSFPILSTWTALDVETLPFADSLTFYGVRIFATGTAGCVLNFDDFRLVAKSETPLNAYATGKQFSFGSLDKKDFRGLLVDVDIPQDSIMYVDIFKDFGTFISRFPVAGKIDKEIFVSGYRNTENITRLSSIDFEILDSTQATISSVFSARPIVSDNEFVYAGDQQNNRIFKIDKSSFHAIISTYGSLGSGSTNFNTIYQMAVDDSNLYVIDSGNHRVKIHRKSNLEFSQSFGTLGKHTTSFHSPSGVAVDMNSIYIGNDANFNILKLSKSTGGFENSVTLNYNTIGDITLAIDELYLYAAYNSIDPRSLDHIGIFVEKRNKVSLDLIDKIQIFPKNTIVLSTYTLLGDIAISDNNFYISFTNANLNYYIQKRLKDDFSIILENISTARQFAVAVNGLASKSKRKLEEVSLETDGRYIQVKYSDGDKLNNPIRINSQVFKLFKEDSR